MSKLVLKLVIIMTQESPQLINLNDLKPTQIEQENPFETSKVKRKLKTKDCRILFLYPNERGMSTIPPSITALSQILKDEGHQTALFDTTFYKFDDEILVEDSESIIIIFDLGTITSRTFRLSTCIAPSITDRLYGSMTRLSSASSKACINCALGFKV